MANTLIYPQFTLGAPTVDGTNVTINYTIIDGFEKSDGPFWAMERTYTYSELISAKIYYKSLSGTYYVQNQTPYSIIDIPVNQPEYSYITSRGGAPNAKSFEFLIQGFQSFTNYQYYIEFEYQMSYSPPVSTSVQTSQTFNSANYNVFKTGATSPAITVPVLDTKPPGSITQTSAISGGDI